jgi:hypothetical protein
MPSAPNIIRPTCTAGVSDNDIIAEVTGNGDLYNTWQLGSTAGAMDVEVSLDGTNYFATVCALIDLTSTAPSTAVTVTAAGKNYGFKGRYKKVRVRQNGATAVANPILVGYQG